MPFDADDDDDRPVGGMPLPPDDRLWRHPSEIGAATTATPPASTDGHGTRVWAVAVVAGLIGSALSLGVVAVTGGLSNDVIEKPVTQRVATPPIAEINSSSSKDSVIAVSRAVAPAIIRLEGTVNAVDVTGSGILIRDDGHIVTNAHLVAGMSNMRVELSDGQEFAARLVGSDSATDVAVVKVDHDQLPVALLGSATSLQSGQTAIAIGSPVGMAGGPTVSVGVISAVGQRVPGHDGVDLRDMIQTDAPLATGSSGGALCDGAGAVIGMQTEVAEEQAASGLGFAIPIDIVRAIADDIMTIGAARHPWLGVEGSDVDAANAKTLGVNGGAKVTKVVENSPAAQAGVLGDDVITAVNGVKVASMASFVVALRSHHPGEEITLEIVRNGEDQLLTMVVTLAEKNA